MQCYMPATGIFIIVDALQYILKAFDFPKTTTEDYLQQEIEDTISIMKYPIKTLPFFSVEMQQTMKTIRLPTFCKEAHLSPVYKFYHYPQC